MISEVNVGAEFDENVGDLTIATFACPDQSSCTILFSSIKVYQIK